jgi:DNA-binding NtrC family response regulator
MSHKQTVLIVEDQASERDALARMLRSEGYAVRTAATRSQSLAEISQSIDLVLCDLRLGLDSGLDVLHAWKEKRPSVPFIMMTAFGDVASAVRSMKEGAIDYLSKPLEPSEVLVLLNRFLPMRHDSANPIDLDGSGIGKMIGHSAQMREVFSKIERVAQSDSTVMIMGESGTGKELVASAIHEHSKRNSGPFVAINVTALPDALIESELFGYVKGAFTGAIEARHGRFQAAHQGTLFMDEIGDFPLALQPKLLRVLEQFSFAPVGTNVEKKVDVRLIAATSRNLPELVASQSFRADLFHRLNVLTIELPPLRDRPEDIPVLVDFFLKDCAKRHLRSVPTIETDLMSFLVSYDWPGNVRQLRNSIENMVVMNEGQSLTREHLPSYLSGDSKKKDSFLGPTEGTLDNLEKIAILNALKRAMGNRTHAAQNLGISVRTLQRKVKQWGIETTPT